MPWHANRPHGVLIASSLGALGVGVALALGPWGRWFGFTELSVLLIAVIGTITLTYLAAAELTKRLAISARKLPLRRTTAQFWVPLV
jgi:Mg2+-importing ATPase